MTRQVVWAALTAIIVGCGGGSGKSEAIVQPDAGTPDAGTPDAGTPDAGTPDAGITCTPGDACEAPDSCHAGQFTCNADGTKTCAISKLPDGTSCGSGNSCSAGQCVPPAPPACTPGGACTPSNSCHKGQDVCANGGLVCEDSGNQPDGFVCGDGLTCKAGSCVSPTHCTPGGACQPSNPCHVGSYTCDANDARVCSDTGTNKPEGISCGDGLICKVGACVPKPVPLPTIKLFTASSLELVGAGSTFLSWDVVDFVSLKIDQGIGDVTGVTGKSVSYTLSATKTFTLTATNSAGVSVTKQVTVTVVPPPDQVTRITLDTKTHLMIADGKSHPTLTMHFFNQSGVEMVGVSYDLLANGQTVAGNFVTTIPDTYELVVRSGGVASNPVSITARVNKIYPNIGIALHFIVVNYGEPVGVGTNLAATRIQRMVDLLNIAAANGNGSVDPNAVSLNITFRLAKDGITRVDGRPYDIGAVGGIVGEDVPNDGLFGTNEANKIAEDTFWDPRLVINIWIMPTATLVNGQTATGYSISGLPSVYSGHNIPGLMEVPTGTVVDPANGALGYSRIDTNQADYAIVHEVAGHRLGLLHVFSWSGCLYDDYANDTFTYDYNTGAACPTNLGVSDHDNYMDYFHTSNTFTYDQRERVRGVLTWGVWMNQLSSSTL